MQTYYKSGSWNVICQVCGRKYKAEQIKKRWDGLLVCEEDYEERNILDFLRTQPERQDVPYQSNEPADVFRPETCSVEGRQGVAGKGTAGCMICGAVFGE